VFAPARDRPILFTASAWAEVLLTLDRRDLAVYRLAGRLRFIDVLAKD